MRILFGFLSHPIRTPLRWHSLWLGNLSGGSGPSTARTVSDILPPKGSRLRRIPLKLLKWACVAYCINTYAFDLFMCIGTSMEPTIRSHDIVITEHFTQRFGELKRGDVVIVRSPTDPATIVCKRIVAKHGDMMADEEGELVKVQRGHVWLEGDNPADSFDSRKYGPVPLGLVLSKIFVRIWPLNRLGYLREASRKPLPGEDFDDDYATVVPVNIFSRSKP